MIPRELLKRVRRVEIAAKRKVTSRFAGGYLSTFRGQGMEFDEVREYAPGDDVRTIDWNVTARAGHPFVKRFVVEREMTVVLAVDLSGSLAFGSGDRAKGELVAELATVLAFLAIRNHDRVGLLLFTDRVERFIPPGKGRKHLYRVIRELSTCEPQGRGTDLGAALDFATRMVARHGTVFVVSDFLVDAAGLAGPLARLALRHDAIAVTVSDPREVELPAVGLLAVRDPETGAGAVVDTLDPAVRAAFAERAAGQRQEIERLLVRHGVDRVPLSTAVDYMAPLMKFFHMRARRLR
ncbi:MAG: DUF58 domain-containing protein [Nitrospirae bacterium]|nr:DUF58 domain-containing protein [Nitrospirota bacterium]